MSDNRFSNELEAARKKLAELGRDVSSEGMVNGRSGMNNNLDLPYSSLPRLNGERWNKRESGTRQMGA